MSLGNASYFQLLKELYEFLSFRRRRQILAVFFLMIASSLAEIFTLASVVPFLTSLADPERLLTNKYFYFIASSFGISSGLEISYFFTATFLILAIIATLVRIGNLRMNSFISSSVGSDISRDIFTRTMYQPLIVHYQNNSSQLTSAISIHINILVNNVFRSILEGFNSAIIILSVSFTLLFIDAKIAIISGALISGFYFMVITATRKKLIKISKNTPILQEKLLQTLNEGLGSIREVLLDGNQPMLLKTYSGIDKPLRANIAEATVLKQQPAFFIELLGIILVSGIALVITIRTGNLTNSIPILGALALGAKRLLPVIQRLFSTWAELRTYKSTVVEILKLLRQQLPILPSEDPSPHFLRQGVKFNNVVFSYPGSKAFALKNTTLHIRAGEKIGIQGKTGSGKSTFIDLFMGLLTPTEGEILVDDKDIEDPENISLLRAWRKSISHVPQSIFLTDDSIQSNIAFGLPEHCIDYERIHEVCEIAQCNEFIADLPLGLMTCVGERGIRLSGGQRQRIGIARALYKCSQVLVLDEATSALDSHTENLVINRISECYPHITILMITHRTSTLSNCDRLLTVDSGVVLQ